MSNTEEDRIRREVIAQTLDSSERLVQIGMRAVIRDIQEFVEDWSPLGEDLEAKRLNAYLMACLITSGAYDDADDPFGELRRELAADHGQG